MPTPSGYANLVDVVVWNLVRRDMIRVVPLRPVQAEDFLFMGGKSFCRLELSGAADPERQGLVAGIEARVLGLIRDADSPEDNDMRSVLRRLPRSRPRPWNSITSWPYTELVEAKMVVQKGFLMKRLEITDPALVERARPRFEKLRAERAAHLQAHPDQHEPVISDALAAQAWLSLRSRF